MNAIVRWVERQPLPLLIGGASLGTLLPLLATMVAQGLVDFALIGLATAWATGGAWAVWHRHTLDALPLVIGPDAVHTELQGVHTYRFCVWLGRGRVLHQPQVVLSWHPKGLAPIRLPVLLPAAVSCGPLVLLHRDDAGRCTSDGAFTLSVVVQEGELTWKAQARWARKALHAGRFKAPVQRQGGRLRWDYAAWGHVEATD